MQHVERSRTDGLAQTGDDKDRTGTWDTAEEEGGVLERNRRYGWCHR